MRLRKRAALGVFAALVTMASAQAADYAGHRHHHRRLHTLRGYVGECVRTRVATIASPAPGGAPVLLYTDGVAQDYDAGMLGHSETRPGDPIQLCLVSFSRDCGGILGHDLQPGRTYATGNLRTGAAWTLPDARSSCARR